MRGARATSAERQLHGVFRVATVASIVPDAAPIWRAWSRAYRANPASGRCKRTTVSDSAHSPISSTHPAPGPHRSNTSMGSRSGPVRFHTSGECRSLTQNIENERAAPQDVVDIASSRLLRSARQVLKDAGPNYPDGTGPVRIAHRACSCSLPAWVAPGWPRSNVPQISGDARCLDAGSLQHVPKNAPDVSWNLPPRFFPTLRDGDPKASALPDRSAPKLPIPCGSCIRRHQNHEMILAPNYPDGNKKISFCEISWGKLCG